MNRQSRPAIFGDDPAVLRVRLADVDDKETDAVAVPPGQPLQRPNLGAEGRSCVRAEDQRHRPLPQEGAKVNRGVTVESGQLEVGGEIPLGPACIR
jgi:hypothetical protein